MEGALVVSSSDTDVAELWTSAELNLDDAIGCGIVG